MTKLHMIWDKLHINNLGIAITGIWQDVWNNFQTNFSNGDEPI